VVAVRSIPPLPSLLRKVFIRDTLAWYFVCKVFILNGLCKLVFLNGLDLRAKRKPRMISGLSLSISIIAGGIELMRHAIRAVWQGFTLIGGLTS
jgi:hypothetical protein